MTLFIKLATHLCIKTVVPVYSVSGSYTVQCNMRCSHVWYKNNWKKYVNHEKPIWTLTEVDSKNKPKSARPGTGVNFKLVHILELTPKIKLLVVDVAISNNFCYHTLYTKYQEKKTKEVWPHLFFTISADLLVSDGNRFHVTHYVDTSRSHVRYWKSFCDSTNNSTTSTCVTCES